MSEGPTIQPPTPAPPIRCLSACPVLIGQTLGYLSDNIIVRFDIDNYLALQRAINVVWAAETRRLMKKGMQQVQAVLAHRLPYNAFKHRNILRNLIFTATLDLSFVAPLSDPDIANFIWNGPLQRKLLMCEIILACAERLVREKAESLTAYVMCGPNIVRGLQLGKSLDYNGATHRILKDVERWPMGGSSPVIRYDFALQKESEDSIHHHEVITFRRVPNSGKVSHATRLMGRPPWVEEFE
jgi:hypothetical protein